jgi:DNA replicative helicase MCM subunit Mcm2 (Cdc46/Mcm family)
MYLKARLRFDEEVSQADIDEAMRLLFMCRASLYEERDKRE